MINRYEIKDDNLYLYIDYMFEIGKIGNNEKTDLIDQIKNYIKNMKIKFKGKYVVLVIAGIATLTLSSNLFNFEEDFKFVSNNNTMEIVTKPYHIENDIDIIDEETVSNENKIETSIESNTSNEIKTETSIESNTSNEIKQEIPKQENVITETKQENIKEDIINNETMVTIYRNNGTILNIELEEYLIGVVAAEMPASFNIEALKAQAIAARTYTLKSIEQNKTLTDTTATQVYKDNNELKSLWGTDYDFYYKKITQAVNDTKGQVITYNDNLIDAVFHSTSNGYTVDAKDVWGNDTPYLKSVESPWDLNATSYYRETNKEMDMILDILGLGNTSDNKIEIISRDKNNRVTAVSVNYHVYGGVEFRNKLGLRSTDFDIVYNGNDVLIATKGYGHGVGMSQYGANGMANSGYKYDSIIKHYYTGVQIKRV